MYHHYFWDKKCGRIVQQCSSILLYLWSKCFYFESWDCGRTTQNWKHSGYVQEWEVPFLFDHIQLYQLKDEFFLQEAIPCEQCALSKWCEHKFRMINAFLTVFWIVLKFFFVLSSFHILLRTVLKLCCFCFLGYECFKIKSSGSLLTGIRQSMMLSGNLNLRGRMELCSIFKFQFPSTLFVINRPKTQPILWCSNLG